MKMKSNVFGHSAKLALAVLAVCGALFTSCYEKEDVDSSTLTAAEYYIAGTITDAKTGGVMMNASVTINGAAITVANGSFVSGKLTYTASVIPVVVSANGYNTFTKNVLLSKVGNGAIYIADASVSLVSVDAIELPGDETVLAESIATVNVVLTDALVKPMAIAGLTFIPYAKIERATDILVDYTAALGTEIASGSVKYISYNGFELVGAVTRVAATAEETTIFKAAVASKTGKRAGITQRENSTIVPEIANNLITGYRVVYNLVPRTYSFLFNGANFKGTVVSQEGLTLYPRYYNYNTHQSHDGHGINPNAGGGSGSY